MALPGHACILGRNAQPLTLVKVMSARGVVLVNAAGRFDEVKQAVEAPIEAALSKQERAGLEASLELASDAAASSSAQPVRC